MSAASRDAWSVPADELLRDLATSRDGLSAAEAARRLVENGPNVPAPRRRTTPARLVAAQLASPITLLLLVAAILSMLVGEVVDGAIILGILLVSGALGVWQEHRAADAIDGLLALVRTTASVRRDGAWREVAIESVVPGDVVRLAAGAGVPGDARLLEANDLHVDEAALTGESFPVGKSPAPSSAGAPLAERANAVHLGTHVVSGTATAVVVRTGAGTEFGAIAQRLALRPPTTAFEHGVRRFGYLLLEITTALVIVILALNVWRGRPVLDVLLFTLALAVGLTPQLLPAIVSVTLAQGARHMARERVIVRRLTAIEDLGGMQLLCTDKTGTITEGVVAVHAAADAAGAPSARVRLLACLNAAFETGFANPIDDALRAAPPPEVAQWTKAGEIPYDFVRRRLSVVAAHPDGQRLLVTKGALAAVLDVCRDAEDAAGRASALADVRAAIEARAEALGRDGYRCLGVACRALADDRPVTRDDERALTFVGILSLADPVKPHAAASLRDLERLGIRVALVTGDDRHVAARVATEVGLHRGRVVTGAELHAMSEAALVRTAPRVGVFAEVEPQQKERVIRALRKAGHAVGYLGDGINDAAALHAADVGISVDSATDVTRQAADIVLLDKDLAVLGAGVREGRRAFANTLKYVLITTSASFGNMLSMAGASIFAAFLPLLPKQILLLNVLTDLPAMAVATDRLDPELVARPRRWNDRDIGRFMLAFGLVSSAFDFLTIGALLALRVGASAFRTAWFLESVLSELVVLLVIRTRRPFFRSRPATTLLWTSVGVGAAAIALPYTPLARPLGFVALPPLLALLVAGIVGVYAVGSEASKRVLLRRTAA